MKLGPKMVAVAFALLVLVSLVGAVMQSNASESQKEVESIPSHVVDILDDQANPGDFVFLNDVKLEAGPAADLFYATGPKGGKILVVGTDSSFTMKQDGILADIQGTIQRVPSLAVLRTRWNLKRSVQKELSTQAIYLAASKIRAAAKKP